MGIGAAKHVILLKNSGGGAAAVSYPGSTGLIAAYALDESSGDAVDAGPNSLDLQDTNTVTANASGKIAGSRVFTKANTEYFTIADNAAFDWSGDFCIDGWLKPTAAEPDARPVVSQWLATGNQKALMIYLDASNVCTFFVSNDGSAAVSVQATTFGALSADTWYHFHAEHENGVAIRLSINNGTFDATAHTTGVFNSTADFRIGARGDAGTVHSGELDNIVLYSRLWSSAEKAAVYNNGDGVAVSTIIA